MSFALSSLDIGIIVTSIVAVVCVGLWAGRNQEKTARGYFLASGRLPWYIIGAAFVSSSVSSEQIVGTGWGDLQKRHWNRELGMVACAHLRIADAGVRSDVAAQPHHHHVAGIPGTAVRTVVRGHLQLGHAGSLRFCVHGAGAL